MKRNGRLHVGKSLLIGVPLPNDYTFQANRISDISVRMFLDDDFDVLGHDHLLN
jgi:hypothetical protein